ncbi:TPA: PTS sugar transporter subunit IIA [Streptococcus suis]|nr:PTS sugar transporter subunit IIA [Streptococcus suis]NQH31768.1 PTS sugar transporter subunit IIA [Streptococcus suis]NQN18081.1 PTS sugar transporter subunit IIA [Streptococcus suis]NQP47971.1 PTS sugar transporter subunit IIA [Streptococcus suis]NQP56063.1 PTS sugar transporter subunit IIA [Streptococcus suis]CYU86625.1 PTS system transporter subunit IIA [Streptococcus suis]
MFKIIIATHGEMSTGIKDAVETIAGIGEDISTLNLISGKDVNDLGREYLELLESPSYDKGVLIFTDLTSASPYNQALLAINSLEQSKQSNVFVIGGVNLPMVLEAVNHNLLNSDLKDVVDLITSQGKSSIEIWDATHLENADDEDDDF